MSLQATQDTIRRGAAFVAIAFVIYYGGKIAIKGGVALYRYLNPPPPPGPDFALGKLAHPDISSLKLDNNGVTYTLDTTTGSLPSFPKMVKVFEIDDPVPDLLSGSKARELALSFGFKSSPRELSRTEYLWEEPETGRRLEVNIASGNFKLETDGVKLREALKAGETYSPLEATTRAKALLKSKGLLPDTLENGIQKTTLVEINADGALQQALSLSSAQLIKVDFFRNLKIDDKNFPVYGQNKAANVTVYLAGQTAQTYEVPLVYYTTWNPLLNKFGTYYLDDVPSAWDKVKSGQAFVVELHLKDADPFAKFKELTVKDIFVRDIYLAYFEDTKIHDFMVPIYVFEGEAKTKDNQTAIYTAFTWAVAKDWLE